MFLVSSPGQPKSSSTSHALGSQHYSWKIVANKFLSLFDRSAILYRHIDNIHRVNARNMEHYGIAHNLLHISFLPFENLRICKVAKNVAHVAWEFANFPPSSTMHHISSYPGSPMNTFLSPVLNQFDQIWTGCKFTQQAIRRSSSLPVFYVPAPIMVAPLSLRGKYLPPRKIYLPSSSRLSLERMRVQDLDLLCYPLMHVGHRFSTCVDYDSVLPVQFKDLIMSTHSSGGRVFGSVLNPHDWRKNLLSMVRGFSIALSEDRHSILILKFSCQEKAPGIYRNMFNWLLQHTHAAFYRNVYFCCDYIESHQMGNFLTSLDFYLCTSYCEGQNLPLLESMYCGVVPVSTANTAMDDYITTENAFVISSVKTTVDFTSHPNPLYWGLTWMYSPPDHVAQAIVLALSANHIQLAKMSRNAKMAVSQLYSDEAVLTNINSALASLKIISSITHH